MGILTKIIIDVLEVLFISAAVFVLVYLFVGQPLEITGTSMYPTFHDKEQIIAEKLSIKYKPIKRGEVVVFNEPNSQRMLIKRVVGLPKERVLIKEGIVYINGNPLSEPYVNEDENTTGDKTIQEGEDFFVPDDSYILMGDNRQKSSDSRNFGPVDKNDIIGRGFIVYYPFENLRLVKNTIFNETNVLSQSSKNPKTIEIKFPDSLDKLDPDLNLGL